MKLIGLMPARNESWVLGLSARVALEWCDMLMVGDHTSTDDTARVLSELRAEHPGRVCSLQLASDANGTWPEMAHRQMLLLDARAHGATHIAIIDADELLSANLLPTIREHVYRLPNGCILEVPGYNLRGDTLARYHVNGMWGNRVFDLVFADAPALCWSGDMYHHRKPMGAPLRSFRPSAIQQGKAGVLHLWGVTERRLRARHAWYKITERLRWPDKPAAHIDEMYSWAIKGRGPRDCPASWAYASVPSSWLKPYEPWISKHLHLDAIPWQETEAKRLYVLYGPERFRGLDLFGVA